MCRLKLSRECYFAVARLKIFFCPVLDRYNNLSTFLSRAIAQVMFKKEKKNHVTMEGFVAPGTSIIQESTTFSTHDHVILLH